MIIKDVVGNKVYYTDTKAINPISQEKGRIPISFEKWNKYIYFNPTWYIVYAIFSTIFFQHGWTAWLFVAPYTIHGLYWRDKITLWERETREEVEKRWEEEARVKENI